jgi:hypothetical protein
VSVTAVERKSSAPQLTDKELLQIFAGCKLRHGDDIGLMIVGLHLENLARIEDLELRLAKLETKKR